jgi:transposase InsO family protein
VRFGWIEEHKDEFPADPMCRVLQVSRSGYYAWQGRQGRPPGPRAERRQELVKKIRDVHQESRQVYGSPRVYQELKAQGESVCENTVAKLMKEHQIRSVVRKRFRVKTTDSSHAHPIAPNVLERQFQQDLPDQAWAADITYVPTEEGWLYLAAVIDLCSRKVVGWAMADHLRAQLCTEALEMALARRKPGAGLLHHSDRGVQYACNDYRELLEEHGIQCSMSGKGDCYDNAVIESFFKTLKTELVYQHEYQSREEAKRSIFEYVEVFYNRKRRHSSLGYLSPCEYEAQLN